MALTYPLTFPTVNGESIIKSCNLKLVHSAAMTQSATNYKQLITNYTNAQWQAEITLRPLDRIEGMAFSAFIAALGGVTQKFQFGNPLMVQTGRTASHSGATTIDVGSTTMGIALGDSNGLPAGSHFEVNNELYMTLEDISNGSGSVSIAPALKTEVTAAQSLTIDLPKTSWRLSRNDIGWDINQAGFYDFSFNCIEAQ